MTLNIISSNIYTRLAVCNCLSFTFRSGNLPSLMDNVFLVIKKFTEGHTNVPPSRSNWTKGTLIATCGFPGRSGPPVPHPLDPPMLSECQTACKIYQAWFGSKVSQYFLSLWYFYIFLPDNHSLFHTGSEDSSSVLWWGNSKAPPTHTSSRSAGRHRNDLKRANKNHLFFQFKCLWFAANSILHQNAVSCKPKALIICCFYKFVLMLYIPANNFQSCLDLTLHLLQKKYTWKYHLLYILLLVWIMCRPSCRSPSLASGSEFKVNYCYWTKLFSDIISLILVAVLLTLKRFFNKCIFFVKW